MFPFTHGIIASSSATAQVSTDFIIRVKTDNAGTSASNQFTLPTTNIGGPIYDYNIDWGDGVVEDINTSAPQTHTYSSAGIYTIKISGTFERIYFNNGGDKLKLIEILNFGDVGWISLAVAFAGCTNNVINVNCSGNFDGVISAQQAFQNNAFTFFPAIDMPNVTNFDNTFRNCNLTSFPLINMSSATTIRECFMDNDLDDVPAINLPNVTDTLSAFRNNGVISSFAMRDFYAMSIGNSMFNGTTLPTADYSDILITQNANNPNNSVTLHGGNSTYNASASSARSNLVSVKLWSITDGGLV